MTTREMIYIIRYRARQLQQERDSYDNPDHEEVNDEHWFELNYALSEVTRLADDLEQMLKDEIPF